MQNKPGDEQASTIVVLDEASLGDVGGGCPDVIPVIRVKPPKDEFIIWPPPPV